jgi:hypothetical protein
MLFQSNTVLHLLYYTYALHYTGQYLLLVSSSVSSNFTLLLLLLLLKTACQTTVKVQIILCIPPQYCTSDKSAYTETEFIP